MISEKFHKITQCTSLNDSIDRKYLFSEMRSPRPIIYLLSFCMSIFFMSEIPERNIWEHNSRLLRWQYFYMFKSNFLFWVLKILTLIANSLKEIVGGSVLPPPSHHSFIVIWTLTFQRAGSAPVGVVLLVYWLDVLLFVHDWFDLIMHSVDFIKCRFVG